MLLLHLNVPGKYCWFVLNPLFEITILILHYMSKTGDFLKLINNGYECNGDYIALGSAILDGEVVPDARVKVPLKTLNRHGLIAGATGTGKTKTLQVISEQLSEKGVPVLLMDVKGDLSGIAMAGEEKRKNTSG